MLIDSGAWARWSETRRGEIGGVRHRRRRICAPHDETGLWVDGRRLPIPPAELRRLRGDADGYLRIGGAMAALHYAADDRVGWLRISRGEQWCNYLLACSTGTWRTHFRSAVSRDGAPGHDVVKGLTEAAEARGMEMAPALRDIATGGLPDTSAEDRSTEVRRGNLLSKSTSGGNLFSSAEGGDIAWTGDGPVIALSAYGRMPPGCGGHPSMAVAARDAGALQLPLPARLEGPLTGLTEWPGLHAKIMGRVTLR